MGKNSEKNSNKNSCIYIKGYGITWSEGFWLLLFLFVLTQPFTTDFVSKVLVKYVFRHFPSEGFTITGAILWIILFLGALVSLWRKSWKTVYIVKDISFLIGSMGFLIFLIYHRCSSALFIFYPLFPNDISSIRMVDLPLIFLSITTIFLIANHFRKRCTTDFDNEKKQNLRSYIQADVPIKDLDADEFNREKVFESLLDTISSNSISEDKSIAIALVNRWGEGKTSFLEILDKEINEKKDTLVVSFNPWLSSQPDNLTFDFFNTLDKALSPHIYTGRLFRQYAQSLTKIDTVYNPLLYLPRQWLGHRSNQDYFDEIKELIERIEKRIFILIDDMDRLHPKEIFELLRMIRNSASFPHMIFVVPFEREYVTQALDQNQIHNGSEYLKKIFDVEITLPPIAFTNIQDLLDKKFGDILDSVFIHKKGESIEESKKEIANQFKRCIGKDTQGDFLDLNTQRYETIIQLIKSKIKNNRDVIRFLNSLSVNLKNNHSRIYLPDLLILEFIKIKDIREYRVIFEKYDYFLAEKLQITINLTPDNHTPDPVKVKEEDEKNSKGNIYKITDLRQLLFRTPEKDYNFENAFCHALNISNYLEYRMKGISQKELMILYEKGHTSELIEVEKNNPILERLEIYIKSTLFVPQMEGYIKIALFYSNKLEETEEIKSDKYYRVALILSKLMISDLIENNGDINRFIDIIKESTYNTISKLNGSLIYVILGQKLEGVSQETWNENKEQVKKLLKALQKINENCLQNAINEKLSFDRIENLFWNCIEKFEANKPVFTKKALCIYREYIDEKPEEYLKHFIRAMYPAITDFKRFRHIPSYYYEQIFSSFKDWLKFIERQVDPHLFHDIDKFMNIYNEKSDRNENDPFVILYASANQTRHDMKLTYQDHLKVNSECLPLLDAEENESLI